LATRVELREALLEAEPLLAEGVILPLPLSRPGYEPVRFSWRALSYGANWETDLLMQSGTDVADAPDR
jgi:hypothetical protein